MDGATNQLRQLLAAGSSAVGAWCSTPSPFVVELLTAEPVDYVVLDCQHGLVELAHLAPMLAAVRPGVTPLVRVSAIDPAAIGKALDMGAAGVIVPYVESAAEAEVAVAACRYPPRGRRSYGPTRAGLALGNDPAVLGAHPLCFVMVETPAGVARATDICSVEGLDGVYIGPADLAIGLGVPLAEISTSPVHLAALDEVRAACRAAGLYVGIHTNGGADARARFAAGFQFCSLATDGALLRAALHRELGAARAEPA